MQSIALSMIGKIIFYLGFIFSITFWKLWIFHKKDPRPTKLFISIQVSPKNEFISKSSSKTSYLAALYLSFFPSLSLIPETLTPRWPYAFFCLLNSFLREARRLQAGNDVNDTRLNACWTGSARIRAPRPLETPASKRNENARRENKGSPR